MRLGPRVDIGEFSSHKVGFNAVDRIPAPALPQPESPKRSNQDKAPNKPYLMQLLLAVLRDKAIAQRFFDTLPQATRQVIAALTWTRRGTIAALEQTLGQEIARPNPDQQRFYCEPFLLPPEHGFVVI